MATFRDFEKSIAELDARIEELRETAQAGDINIDAEIEKLEARSERMLRETYGRLTPRPKTLVCRPLAGARAWGEAGAIVGGLGKLHGRRIVLIGHEKGDDTASRLKHNFGM